MLKDQNREESRHMILVYLGLVYLGEDKTKLGQKIKRSFYYFPKRLAKARKRDVGVIGGTFIEGATKDTPNEEECDILLEGAKTFYELS